MALPPISVDDFFPIIRQTILDTFHVDSYLMREPYNYEYLDLGLRKMVWDDYSTSPAYFTLPCERDNSVYQIIVLESLLGFNNLLVELVPGDKPTYIGFLPFRTEPVNMTTLSKIMKQNGIPSHHGEELYNIYSRMPVLQLDNFILTLQHLIAAFLPPFVNNRVDYINYSSEQHEISTSEERIEHFMADYISQYTSKFRTCIDYITAGNQAGAAASLKSLLDFSTFFPHNLSLSSRKI